MWLKFLLGCGRRMADYGWIVILDFDDSMIDITIINLNPYHILLIV